MEDDEPFDFFFMEETVPEELYELVRQNLYSQLDTRLHELSNSIEYLTSLTLHGQGRLSLLMVAAINGHDEVVRILLTHSNPSDQIKLRGNLKIANKEAIDGATALYCACYYEHFTVAQTLIELGKANVDEDTNDYPDYSLFLHAAMNNKINIIHFLIENKYADVNNTKSRDYEQRTSLICAASCGHISLIKYLIDLGADINYACKNEDANILTPFSCAIINGEAEAAQLLYELGANMNFESHVTDHFLNVAIQNKYYSIIIFLLERSMCTVEDVEFAGSTLIDVSFTLEKMQESLQLLRIALQKRETMNLPKVCIQSIIAYDYNQECQTVDEFDQIKNDHNRILIETLLIRERFFLLRQDLTIIKPIFDYGSILLQRGEFDRCFNLWIHVCSLTYDHEMTFILHDFVLYFCDMLTANQKLSVKQFLQVSQLIFQPFKMDDNNNVIITYELCLVVIATKILQQDGISKDEKIVIYSWIKDLCRQQLITENGETLLHFCVSRSTMNYIRTRNHHILNNIVFPNESALRLLLTYGRQWLDIDAVSSSGGRTPLHAVCDSTQDQQIIKLLLDFGCHIDCVNSQGYMPMNYFSDETMLNLFRPKKIPWNLKCLCARNIATQQLNMEPMKVLSTKLKRYIVLHGGTACI